MAKQTPFDYLCKNIVGFYNNQTQILKKETLTYNDITQIKTFLSASHPFADELKNREWINDWLNNYFNQILTPFKNRRIEYLYSLRYRIARLIPENFGAFLLLQEQLDMEFSIAFNTIISKIMQKVYEELKSTSSEIIFQFLNPDKRDLFIKGEEN